MLQSFLYFHFHFLFLFLFPFHFIFIFFVFHLFFFVISLEREEFIKRKYVAREFVATPSTNLSEDLKRFIEADDILGMLSCIVSGVDKNAYPYIAFAVRRRSVEAVTLLILNGFDANAPLDGVTPLQDAANANDCIMIAILLRGKADPDLKNKDGKTPYDITTELEDKRQKDDANQYLISLLNSLFSTKKMFL